MSLVEANAEEWGPFHEHGALPDPALPRTMLFIAPTKWCDPLGAFLVPPRPIVRGVLLVIISCYPCA